MRWLANHPLAQLVAVVCAVGGVAIGAAQWSWHRTDQREAAEAAADRELQLRWLENDREWNAEIISRLAAVEAALAALGDDQCTTSS